MNMKSEAAEMTTVIDQDLVADPFPVGQYEVQPIARAQGRAWRAPGGEGQGMVVKITPTAVRVTSADGDQSLVSIPPSDDTQLRGMAAAALAIAAICNNISAVNLFLC